MSEAEVGALTVLPCARPFQPAHRHFSCYKWQTVILKARHDEGERFIMAVESSSRWKDFVHVHDEVAA